MLLFTGEDDLREVRSAVADLAGRWKDLGVSLGVHFSDLDAIHSSSSSGFLREMLAIWLKQSYNVRSTLTLYLPCLIYYPKCTSLASKGSRLEPMKNLSSYELSP